MGRFISETVGYVPSQRRTQLVASAGSSACCLWTVPSGVTEVTFEIWGGGGAGGPKCCCYCGASSGGSAGGYAIKTVATSAGQTYTLCAGGPGEARYCSVGGSNIGCQGCTSFATGTGLTNFCATGGAGGYTVCCIQMTQCCGGNGFGGDFNIPGGDAWQKGGCGSWICHFSAGGAAAFSGHAWHSTDHCCAYFSPGRCGVFPGGGGGGFFACACDCCGCQGGGASGLVKVTF